MGNRRKSRECALQILYQRDFSSAEHRFVSENYWNEAGIDEETKVFALELINGVDRCREELDAIIARHSENWKLQRMAAVDKNILRIATYELLHCPDIPMKVTINEAIEIARRFGTEQSSSFINGVLDHVAQEVKKGE
ncbi:MAG: transcription antitermination factor NusB [Deltaproteobacteria bacterium RIFCSPLOWO2_02_FULL_44_10]|nr:MAG: transcription antitermination factor NusB [Deltaproteobacteria bacterium RIFCSPHIGHO2_02_FULL_44_16]OGQ46055.1 MAG: transcription antitermination factor NusB [Deltaproteobacteria bacterium RIFCSPLOWO2_02_FULL_44_10]